MKFIKLSFIQIILILFISCSLNKNEKNKQESNLSSNDIDNHKIDTVVVEKTIYLKDSLIYPGQSITSNKELKRKMLNGDIEAYNKFKMANLSEPDAILFWALYMSNKKDYKKAYYDVFYCLRVNSCNGFSLDNMDKKTKKIALEYLLLAAEKGDNHAIEIINEYYPNLKREINIKQKNSN